MRKFSSLPLLCVLLAAASPALASITYETNQSNAQASYHYQYNDRTPYMSDGIAYASGFGPMNLYAARAYQDKLSADATFTGTYGAELATANATLNIANNCAEQWGAGSGLVSSAAIWDFTFTLDQAHDFAFTGTVGPGLQGSYVSLYGYDAAGDTYGVFFQDVGFASSNITINQTGSLEAGRYWLYVQSQLSTNVPYSEKSSGFDLDFAVAPPTIPEPASVTLALGGLAMLFRKRRR